MPREGWGLEEIMQINYKMSFIKDSFQRLCQHFMCTSHWLFWKLYIKLHYKKMNISEYVCKTCLKGLAINTGKPLRNYCSLTFLKILLFPFCHVFKTRAPHNDHFLKCNNKICLLHQYEQYIYGILAYNGNSSKIFFLI